MNTEENLAGAFRRPSAFLPILMSLAAVGVIALQIACFGPAPQPDEGAAAHLWQLLMGAQIPFIAFFLIRRTRQAPRAALVVVGAQLGAALAPVFFLKW